jgi:hypothetical protein
MGAHEPDHLRRSPCASVPVLAQGDDVGATQVELSKDDLRRIQQVFSRASESRRPIGDRASPPECEDAEPRR